MEQSTSSYVFQRLQNPVGLLQFPRPVEEHSAPDLDVELPCNGDQLLVPKLGLVRGRRPFLLSDNGKEIEKLREKPGGQSIILESRLAGEGA